MTTLSAPCAAGEESLPSKDLKRAVPVHFRGQCSRGGRQLLRHRSPLAVVNRRHLPQPSTTFPTSLQRSSSPQRSPGIWRAWRGAQSPDPAARVAQIIQEHQRPRHIVLGVLNGHRTCPAPLSCRVPGDSQARRDAEHEQPAECGAQSARPLEHCDARAVQTPRRRVMPAGCAATIQLNSRALVGCVRRPPPVYLRVRLLLQTAS